MFPLEDFNRFTMQRFCKSELSFRSSKGLICPHRIPRRSRCLTPASGGANGSSPTSPPKRFELHVDQTTVSFPLAHETGVELDAQLNKLLQTFAAKAKAERPKRWESLEYRHRGTEGDGSAEFLEVFCNPNAHDTLFNAKLLVTLRHCGVSAATEVKFPTFKADLDNFLS